MKKQKDQKERLITALNKFHFNEACGFTEVEAIGGAIEDMTANDMYAIYQANKGDLCEIMYSCYKLGYMRAKKIIDYAN